LQEMRGADGTGKDGRSQYKAVSDLVQSKIPIRMQTDLSFSVCTTTLKKETDPEFHQEAIS
ncbi:MAG: hypothetical protein U9R75_11860, partial [Candidatus Thermoplasmatota archaeon]|nr:hypothetical protein [Candidatus Thermoplasmatota archaeon]